MSKGECIHVLIYLIDPILNLRSDIWQAFVFQASSEWGCSQSSRASALRWQCLSTWCFFQAPPAIVVVKGLLVIGVAFGAEEFQVTFLVKINVVSLSKLHTCVFLFITIVIILYRRLITPVASLNYRWRILRCPWVRSKLHRKMILFHWDKSNRGWDRNHVVM